MKTDLAVTISISFAGVYTVALLALSLGLGSGSVIGTQNLQLGGDGLSLGDLTALTTCVCCHGLWPNPVATYRRLRFRKDNRCHSETSFALAKTERRGTSPHRWRR